MLNNMGNIHGAAGGLWALACRAVKIGSLAANAFIRYLHHGCKVMI